MSIEFEDIVRTGDRVDLKLISRKFTDDDDDQKNYVTQVYDINEDGDLELLMPMEKTKLILLPVESEYEVTIYCRKGIYGCNMKVASRYKMDSIFVLVMDQITELEKQQRREFFRFDCIIGMNTRELTEENTVDFTQNRQYILLPEPEDKSVIVDISGGGLRFISAVHYETGHLIHCKFILNIKGEPRKFEVMLQLLAKHPVVNNPNNTEFRGQFFDINSADRENIIKFIFEEQRKSRKKD